MTELPGPGDAGKEANAVVSVSADVRLQLGARSSVTATFVSATLPKLVTVMSKLAVPFVKMDVGFAVFVILMAGLMISTAVVSELDTGDITGLPFPSTG